jgi:hypothetical protein
MFEPGKEYYTAFAQMQLALKPIKKAKRGHNWAYAAIDDIWQVIVPILGAHGFIVESSRKYIGTQMFLRTCLIHTDSLQGVEDVSPLMAYANAQYDDQEAGENVTYQRRYALIVLLNLQMEEDRIEKRPRIDHKRHDTSDTIHDGHALTITVQQVQTLQKLLAECPNRTILEKNIVSFNKISALDQLTADQYTRVLTYIKENGIK